MGKMSETLIMDQMGNHADNFKLVQGMRSCFTNLLEFYEEVSDWVDTTVDVLCLNF